MVPNASWIDALKLPARVVTGVFLACVALLAIDQYKIISLTSFGELTRPFVIVMAVTSGALSITLIAGFIIDRYESNKKHSLVEQRRQAKEEDLERKRKEKIIQSQQNVITRIEHLDPRELRYLADCLRNKSQSFYTYVHSPYASTLGSKGLISSPGGAHHQDHYPFIINDFVWNALLEMKDEILKRDAENVIN